MASDEGHFDKHNWFGVALVANPNRCFEYPWPRKGRYVSIHYQGRRTSAHRVICELAHGEPPVGSVARHSCDNPKCCNPHHLSWSTQVENIGDALSRGRFALGVKHGLAKLDDEQVIAIRALVGSGASMRTVAQEFGVSRPCVKQIVSRRTWAHVA